MIIQSSRDAGTTKQGVLRAQFLEVQNSSSGLKTLDAFIKLNQVVLVYFFKFDYLFIYLFKLNQELAFTLT